MSDGNSIIHLGDLSKLIIVLIENYLRPLVGYSSLIKFGE